MDLALILGLFLFQRDAPRVEVLVDGRRLEARAELQGDRLYVAAPPLARALGLRFSYDPRDLRQGFLIQGEEGFLLLDLSPLICHVNRKDAGSGSPVFYLDSRTNTPMVPAELVARAFGARVEEERDGDGRRRLSITTSAEVMR